MQRGGWLKTSARVQLDWSLVVASARTRDIRRRQHRCPYAHSCCGRSSSSSGNCKGAAGGRSDACKTEAGVLAEQTKRRLHVHHVNHVLNRIRVPAGLKLERAEEGGRYGDDHDDEGGDKASRGEGAAGQDEGGECKRHAVLAVVA